MNKDTQTEIEAAVFRRLLKHLDDNKDVQNIDLMNLANFCRNCLSKWYVTASQASNTDTDTDTDIDYERAREIIYGMPFPEWKRKYQKQATEAQLALFSDRAK
jgi:hypothetical protein